MSVGGVCVSQYSCGQSTLCRSRFFCFYHAAAGTWTQSIRIAASPLTCRAPFLVLIIKSCPFWVVLVPGERLLLSGDVQIRGMSLCLPSALVSREYTLQFQEVAPYKHSHKHSHKGTEANETTLGEAWLLSAVKSISKQTQRESHLLHGLPKE